MAKETTKLQVKGLIAVLENRKAKHHPECPAVGGYPCYCNGEQLEPYYIGEVVKDE